ncbi:MAG: hypothetical protein AAFY14_09895 [Pseudomonadota bacterium]
MAQEFLGDRYDFYTRALPRSGHIRRQRRLINELAGDIVIFLKRADRGIAPDILEELRKTVRGMAIDYVDSRTYPPPEVPIDAHISASFAGKNAMDVLLSGAFNIKMNDKTAAHVVLHHADPRITQNQSAGEHPKLCYFGDLQNAYLPDFARPEILSLSEGESMPLAFYEEMLKYNMHYCVRDISARNPRLIYKPFTKGFNAAASHANVLVNRQVPDAEYFLGDDYPFLIDDITDDSLHDGFDRVKSAYGTPIWEKGLRQMAHVRSRVAPREIAHQLDTVLQTML